MLVVDLIELPMKNIEPKTKLEVVLDYLNQLAESFEKGKLQQKEFVSLCKGILAFVAEEGSIDRIQEGLLKAQAEDISFREYTRFCDPDDDYPEPITEGFDSQGYAE